jgi:hypothetical protein
VSLEIEARARRANLLTRDDQLDQLFGEDSLDRFLLDVLAKKEGRMTEIRPEEKLTTERVETQRTAPTKPPQRLRLGVALTAFVLVIAAGIGFVLVRDANVAASPIEIGESFLNARDTWDLEAAIALLAPEATVVGSIAPTVADYAGAFEYFRAVQQGTTVGECTQTNVGPPAEVTCTYSHENAWTRALGSAPYKGSRMTFVIDDGLIQEVTNGFAGFTEWDLFGLWVFNNHPSEYPMLYSEGHRASKPSTTPEAIVLWEQYTAEFVAEKGGS